MAELNLYALFYFKEPMPAKEETPEPEYSSDRRLTTREQGQQRSNQHTIVFSELNRIIREDCCFKKGSAGHVHPLILIPPRASPP